MGNIIHIHILQLHKSEHFLDAWNYNINCSATVYGYFPAIYSSAIFNYCNPWGDVLLDIRVHSSADSQDAGFNHYPCSGSHSQLDCTLARYLDYG